MAIITYGSTVLLSPLAHVWENVLVAAFALATLTYIGPARADLWLLVIGSSLLGMGAGMPLASMLAGTAAMAGMYLFLSGIIRIVPLTDGSAWTLENMTVGVLFILVCYAAFSAVFVAIDVLASQSTYRFEHLFNIALSPRANAVLIGGSVLMWAGYRALERKTA